MKQYQRQVNILLLTVMSVMMSTATFACPTLQGKHVVPPTAQTTVQSGYMWHDNGNPTGNGPNANS